MANKESRYDVVLTVTCVVKKAGAEAKAFATTKAEIQYSGMDYLQVVVCQDQVASFGKSLTETGYAAAAMNGFAAEVAALKSEK
jgi:hypothetical protein